jgi:hypothetical protein
VKVLDRVRQLVALAGSSYEEEARTSAVLACKLIRDHHLELVDPHRPSRAKPAPPPDVRIPQRAKGPGLCPVCHFPWQRGAAIVYEHSVHIHWTCREGATTRPSGRYHSDPHED